MVKSEARNNLGKHSILYEDKHRNKTPAFKDEASNAYHSSRFNYGHYGYEVIHLCC